MEFTADLTWITSVEQYQLLKVLREKHNIVVFGNEFVSKTEPFEDINISASLRNVMRHTWPGIKINGI